MLPVILKEKTAATVSNYSANIKLTKKGFHTFSTDVNLTHIFSSVVTNGGLINSCCFLWKLEETQKVTVNIHFNNTVLSQSFQWS